MDRLPPINRATLPSHLQAAAPAAAPDAARRASLSRTRAAMSIEHLLNPQPAPAGPQGNMWISPMGLDTTVTRVPPSPIPLEIGQADLSGETSLAVMPDYWLGILANPAGSQPTVWQRTIVETLVEHTISLLLYRECLNFYGNPIEARLYEQEFDRLSELMAHFAQLPQDQQVESRFVFAVEHCFGDTGVPPAAFVIASFDEITADETNAPAAT